MDLLIAAADAVPDKKEVSPDLLRGRYSLTVPRHIWIVRVNGQFKIRFIWFKILELWSNVGNLITGWARSYSIEKAGREGSQGGHISKFKVGLRVVKVNKGFNLIYLVIPMILTSIVFIWAKGSVPKPKTKNRPLMSRNYVNCHRRGLPVVAR